ncbi:hypothetical protein [Marinomonas mediterranea]|jgi:hypothetical protein|uniref:Uncharacterized protein n=1 Tax=Marinomonas mediterranea (strain ATCC 700492 / JCM 21426 / NBRC 103028 / MMB-1) TaxID=717774 RepID=F2K1P8_MARM1|nr:hypothetical protein [Marinomonas mediterranea]ADZ93382.1 hypothetical protein Marme_4183 [Marinomonas mediterranea MMB-1]WCN19376.1 hypothetical protein GV053_21180 [Marinomonas mediterranea MMB-1]
MSDSNLMPDKIKSPIQLMAAWFVMLVSVITVLLTTAVNIEKPEWAAGYLVISPTVVVIIVIGCVLLMLTKYRPHLQDGKEYAEWIKEQGAYSQGEFIQAETFTSFEDKEIVKEQVIDTSDINNISVSVIDVIGSSEIVESLKNKGFNAEIYPHRHKEYDKREPFKSIKGEQEGIWIGYRVEANIAIRAINVALKIWPELKYIVIPSDNSSPPDHVNDQIFIGGSSKTPINRGTRPWLLEELKSLKEDIDINEFHRKIREKYS